MAKPKPTPSKTKPIKPAPGHQAQPAQAKKAAAPSRGKKEVPSDSASDKQPSRPAKKVAKKATKPVATTRKKAQSPAPPPDKDAATQDDGDLCGLSIRQALVVDHYLLHFNATQAYMDAGYSVSSSAVANAAASRLLATVKAKAYLKKRAKQMFDRVEEEQDALMRSFTFTAFADPRELSEYFVGACRFCYGKAHRYQYTAGEWDGIMTKHADKQEQAVADGKPMPKPPDPKGGVGFNKKAEPNPDCPECAGLGVGKTILKDTRHLSPAALMLYAGVKEGKDGIEIKMHDQMKARETLAKIRKLFDDNTTVNVNFDADELTAKYANKMAAAHARMAQMRNERFGEGGEKGG